MLIETVSFADKYPTNPVFDNQCLRIIREAVDCLMTTVEDLMNGQTRIVTLKFITAHKDNLREICAVLVKGKKSLPVPEPVGGDNSPIAVLLKVLQWRESESQEVENKRKIIMNMLGMVNKIESGKWYSSFTKLALIIKICTIF